MKAPRENVCNTRSGREGGGAEGALLLVDAQWNMAQPTVSWGLRGSAARGSFQGHGRVAERRGAPAGHRRALRYEAIFRPGPARLYRLRGMGEFLEPKATPFLDTVASSLVAFPGGFVAAGTTAAVVGSFALLAITVATAVFLPLLASATPAVVLPSLAFGATAGAVVGWLLGLLGFQRGRARAG